MATGNGNLFQRTWRGASDDSRALARLLAWTALLDLAVFLALLVVLLLLARASVPHVL